MRRVIAHRLKWDDEGVASTVGTIMALLVFLTFLSMIVNSYVPVWMKDAESSHMNVTFGQFGSLKAGIDMQILGGYMADLAGQHYTPVTIFNPITLGVDGVPIFSAPTLGQLDARQDVAPWKTSFKYFPNKFVSTPAFVNETAGGQVTLTVANRYFVQQTLAYENGAVIRYQHDGQLVRAEPTFEINFVNNTESISMVMISMLGSGSMQGTTTEGVLTKVVSVGTEDYTRLRSDVNITHSSPYGLAWYGFYNSTLFSAFNLTAYSCKLPGFTCMTTAGGPYGILNQKVVSPFFIVNVTWNTGTNLFDVWVQLKNDFQNNIPQTMPISTFRIQKVVMNMAVGGIGSQVNI